MGFAEPFQRERRLRTLPIKERVLFEHRIEPLAFEVAYAYRYVVHDSRVYNVNLSYRFGRESRWLRNTDFRIGVNNVLNAAALTYVAGLITAVLQLLYYVMLVSGMGGRRRD